MQTRHSDEFRSLLLGHRFYFGVTQDREHHRELGLIMHQTRLDAKLTAGPGPLSVCLVARHQWQIHLKRAFVEAQRVLVVVVGPASVQL